MGRIKIEIELPEHITLGDITHAQGAIFNASDSYVDWDILYNSSNKTEAISNPGRILIAIAHQLGKAGL